MAEDLFAHAWARRDRAGEIADRMVLLWNEYIANVPYSPSLLHEGDTDPDEIDVLHDSETEAPETAAADHDDTDADWER